MKKETLKNIFNFLKKEDNINRPFLWMLLNKEPFTEEDLDVRGDLQLFWINPTSLPEGLEVGHDLYLTESPNITSLPKGLKVYFDLYIADTKLEVYTDEELREMVKPDGFIKGMIFR